MTKTAHLDTFARDNLPPPDAAAGVPLRAAGAAVPERLNCATELLDQPRRAGAGRSRYASRRRAACAGPMPTCRTRPTASPTCWSRDMGLVPGNRVLLRAPNNPMLAACWFAVIKAGGIAVATMPLLRAKELAQIIDKAQVSHALCDAALADELRIAREQHPALREVRHFYDSSPAWPGGRDGPPCRQLRQRRHRGRRHLHHRLHLRHHRPAQGHDALPPRRDGDLRLLAAARAAARAPTTSSSAARRWPSPSDWAACCCFR